jgi:cystathionine beta-lyase family protein involved in aluminum resistance
MTDEKKVRRILHFKFTLPHADSAQLLALMKNAAPYNTIFGEMHVRFLQNADDPTKVIQIVEYEAPEQMEASRQSLASDPRVQAYLQVWRAMVPNVEVDVYREIEG